MANDHRKLLSACKSWRRKASKSIARHGVEATIARLDNQLPAPSAAAAWVDSVLARRAGQLARELCGDDLDLEAITHWAVLRELGHPAVLASTGDRYVVELSGVSVSPKRLTFRRPTPSAATPEVEEPIDDDFSFGDALSLDEALEWLDDVIEYRTA